MYLWEGEAEKRDICVKEKGRMQKFVFLVGFSIFDGKDAEFICLPFSLQRRSNQAPILNHPPPRGRFCRVTY